MKCRLHMWLILPLCLAVPSCERSRVIESGASDARPEPGEFVIRKLEKIVIPVIDFEDTTVEEAFDFLRMRSFDLEAGESEKRGVSWIVKSPSRDASGSSAGDLEPVRPNHVPKINYRAKDVGLMTAVEEVARQAHVDVYLTNVGIVVCLPDDSPLPVGKMDGEEVWKIIHKESRSDKN